jgi:sigma-B regulation protein RsbU (phosphoserine phosphatase)
MAKIVLLQQGQATPFDLKQGENIIGRLPECDIQINSNMVSRKHAKITCAGERLTIEDMGSGNGTFVNTTKIEGVSPVKNNDRVKLGPVMFRIECTAAPGEEDSSSAILKQASKVAGVQLNDDGTSTIMGAAEHTEGFGLLDVQPQAKLKAILEITRSLAGNHDIDKILPKILDTLFGIFPHADRGVVLLKDLAGNMVPRAMKHRREDSDDSVKLSRTIVKTVLEQKKAVLSADASSDAQFQASESISSLSIRSMMCVPLLSMSGEAMGLINMDTLNPLSQFKKEDLDIMIAVAGQAAMSYEGARLLQSYVEKQKQDSEMNIARDVQRALLPETMPTVEGYEFYTTYEAAQAVGGDYYDVIPLEDGRICLAFGDVAGKGVPASLVMSRISSVVRSTVEFVTDAAQAVYKINNHMCAKAVEGRFVTFVFVILDTANNTMSLVNAGHMSPMIRKPDGSIEEFSEDSVGVPIGVVPDFPFEAVTRPMNPGETIVIYTDGVSEAMNPASDLYGCDTLKAIISKNSPNATELGKVIRADVKRHANGRPQNDDITLMVFGRNM